MTQPRDIDLSDVAKEPTETSVTEEQDVVGDQPDTGHVVSEDHAQ